MKKDLFKAGNTVITTLLICSFLSLLACSNDDFKDEIEKGLAEATPLTETPGQDETTPTADPIPEAPAPEQEENFSCPSENQLKALADPTRVRIIGLLAHVEMCVGDLCLVLGMSQPAVSHQLRVLRNLRLVSTRKEGKHVFYTLNDEHIHQLYHQCLEHASHE